MNRRTEFLLVLVLLSIWLTFAPGGLVQAQDVESTSEPVVEVTAIPDDVVIVPVDDDTPVIVQQPIRIPDWAWFVFALMGSGIGGGVLFVLYTALDRAASSYPPEAGKELFKGAADSAERAWGSIGNYVKATPTPFDDIPADVLDPFVKAILAKMRARGEIGEGDPTQPVG